MEWERTETRIPIKSWCRDIEPGALRQAVNLTELPVAFHHIALMADCHQGFGMPIGGVLATLDAVIPNAVGVDIGCGMCAVRTSLDNLPRDILERVAGSIRSAIPTGFAHRTHPGNWEGFSRAPGIPVIQRELPDARFQLATLGGGNHFIEIQQGDDGHLWLMLHSGSRNFGYQIARTYHRVATDFCDGKRIDLPDRDIAFLPLETSAAHEYLDAMSFALDFARANRDGMRRMVEEIMNRHTGCGFDDPVDIHHNYAARERHFGREVIVHRKGATSAFRDQMGIVPGSQGTSSYIVRGRGNPDSFMSTSHGAGRVMGRKEAIRTLDLTAVRQKLDRLGIIHFVRRPADLDEAPDAYKNIDEVIALQRDLVDVIIRLQPLAVIKG